MADKTKDNDTESVLQSLGVELPGKKPALRTIAPPGPRSDVDSVLSTIGVELGRDDPAPAKIKAPPAVRLGPEAEAAAQKLSRELPHATPIAEGVPIIGSLPRLATAGVSAAVPGMGQPGDTYGQRFTANEGVLKRASELYGEDNPLWSVIGNVMGGGMAAAPMSATALGGALMGTRGPTAGARVMTGGLGGGGIGGLDAILRGEDPGFGAMVGGAGGALGPVVGEGARAATRSASERLWPRPDALRGVNRSNIDRMTQALDGETPRSIIEGRNRMGPAGMLMDVNPGMTDLAGALADAPGPSKAAIREALRERTRGQRGRMETSLDTNIAPRRDMTEFETLTAEARKKAADPLYDQWRATVIAPTDKLDALIPRLHKSGAFKMADELADITGDNTHKAFFAGPTIDGSGTKVKYSPTAETWDYVKRGLDRTIDAAYTKGDKTLGNALVSLKNEMLAEIEKAPGGKIYKQARHEWASHSEIMDQATRGRDTFLGGRAGMTADELKDELKSVSGPALLARIQGMRGAVAEAMDGALRGDTKARDMLLAPSNIQKMELMVGKDKAKRIVKDLNDERFYMEQEYKVRGNSATNEKQQRRSLIDVEPAPRWDVDLSKPLSVLPPSWRESVRPANIIDAYRGQNNSASLNELAALLQTPQGQALNNLLKGLRRESVRRGHVERGAEAGANALTSMIAMPGTTTARRQYFPTDRQAR